MFKTQNGWTKETMKAQIKAKNNGRQSLNNRGDCAYRNDGGNCCAAGCFIDDHDYSPLIETVAILSAPSQNTIPAKFLAQYPWPLDLEGMSQLQRTHDCQLRSSDMHYVLCSWIDENVEDSDEEPCPSDVSNF